MVKSVEAVEDDVKDPKDSSTVTELKVEKKKDDQQTSLDIGEKNSGKKENDSHFLEI